jgi:hypothetical protein
MYTPFKTRNISFRQLRNKYLFGTMQDKYEVKYKIEINYQDSNLERKAYPWYEVAVYCNHIF